MKVLLATIALVTGTPVSAAEYQPLNGSYAVAGKTLIDAPASEPQDSHFYVDLEGDAARDLYAALKAKPQAGICGAAGDLTKRAGGVQCTQVKGGKEFHCAFGIELRTQQVVPGVVC